MSEQLILLSPDLDEPTFCGVNNQNLLTLHNLHPQVRFIVRNMQVKVNGDDESINRFLQHLQRCEAYCINNNQLTEKNITDLFEPHPINTVEQPQNLILFGLNGKPITARTVNQKRMVEAFETDDMLIAEGPAGSGKTYTAIALAVKALKNKQVRKIILSRPAVEAGEKLGFLPGDLKEKIDPYLQPLYDALEEMLPQQKLQEYMDKGVIQIAPLAFMRGRTLNDAIVILDEAQNTTPQQIKMFMTRLGMHSKMILTGDLTQIDLPPHQTSGLRHAIEVLKDVEGISLIRTDKRDIIRHPLVERIVKAYEENIN